MNKADLLAHQMAKIGALAGGPRFIQAIENARAKEASGEFIDDARVLLRQLAGDPDSGAVDCLRQASQDLRAVENFVGKWESHRFKAPYSDVLNLTIETQGALREFKTTVDKMSAVEKTDVMMTAQFGRMLMGKPLQLSAFWPMILFILIVIFLVVLLLARIYRN